MTPRVFDSGVWRKRRKGLQKERRVIDIHIPGATLKIPSPHPLSLVAQMVKNLPATRETWVLSLGQEDPLEKGMTPTPVFLPGEPHGQRSLVGYSPWGRRELDWVPKTCSPSLLLCLLPGPPGKRQKARELLKRPKGQAPLSENKAGKGDSGIEGTKAIQHVF